jgi:Flp pilus assembly protein TadD
MSRGVLAAAALSVSLTVLAYAPAMRGPFVWDDLSEIAENPAIRTLLPPWRPMFAGGELPHRPVPYLTFAMSHALGRMLVAAGLLADPLDPRPFHVVNLLIHLANGWLLYRVVRDLLGRVPGETPPPRGRAELLAWLGATLWLVHPLQSQAVSYVYQRIELLAAASALTTLAAFLRAAGAPRPRPWIALATIACAIGMACKEWVVVVPPIVLLADRAFLARSWRDVAARRGAWHAVLFATIPIALAVVAVERSRYAEAGFTAWQSLVYAVHQPAVILWYLSRLVMPWGLSFDHGGVLRPDPFGRDAWLLAPALLAVAALVWAIREFDRRPAASFSLLAFLLLLAPTSSIVPVQDPCVEHRMYLASALPITALVTVVGGWLAAAGHARRLLAGGISLLILLATVTASRTMVYRSALDVWQDAARKNGGSSRSLSRLGSELSKLDRHAEAIAACEAAVRRNPANPVPFAALAAALLNAGRPEDAEPVCRAGLAAAASASAFADPVRDRLAMYRGVALDRLGAPEAEGLLRAAVGRRPDWLAAREHLARCLLKTNPREAAAVWASLLADSPVDGYVLFNLGSAVARFDPGQAVAILARAIAVDPRNANAYNNLGGTLRALGRDAEARAAFEACLRIAPGHPQAAANLQALAPPAAAPTPPP